MDEALLTGADGMAIMRTYSWIGLAISFGCFDRWNEVRTQVPPDWGCVRRWTGGGLVDHSQDYTYALIVPRGLPLAEVGTEASYAWIHQALAATLQEYGITASLSGDKSAARGPCFQNPVQQDVMLSEVKIAGAAQRRTRMGLLHQGSIQGVALPENWAQTFAAKLAIQVQTWTPSAEVTSEAARLAVEKYGSQRWLEKY